MLTKKLADTIFYSLDKSIKSYRQFAQKNIKKVAPDITIDQWLLLKTIKENPDLSQKEVALLVFKDYASITRIIEILVNRNFLKRSFHQSDRRRFKLEITSHGEDIISQLIPIVENNRKTALSGISQKEIDQLSKILNTLIHNCQTQL